MLCDIETEKTVGSKLRNTKSLSKDDLEKMVHWKFSGLPREKRVMKFAQDNDEEDMEKSFDRALDESDEAKRFAILDNLKGIGPAMAPVILTFYDPKNYGVFDIHGWRELFGKEPYGLFQGSKYLIKYLSQLREIAKEHGLSVRQVEKALFYRNYKPES